MIITRIEPTPPYPQRIRSEADEMGLTRSPGLHLTPILEDLEKLVRAKDEWCTDEELRFYAAGGFLWERVFAMAHSEAIETGDMYRPGEFELDGITGSPDLIRVSDWTLIETKHTWKSVKKFDNHLERYFWKWLCQTKAYCKMIGTDTVEFNVFFVCGDWIPPVPQTRTLQIEYEEIELEENWEMIYRHAKRKGWI